MYISLFLTDLVLKILPLKTHLREMMSIPTLGHRLHVNCRCPYRTLNGAQTRYVGLFGCLDTSLNQSQSCHCQRTVEAEHVFVWDRCRFATELFVRKLCYRLHAKNQIFSRKVNFTKKKKKKVCLHFWSIKKQFAKQ